MLSGALAIAGGSVALHLKQARDLGKAENDCDLRFAIYRLARTAETQRLLADVQAESEAALEQARRQRDQAAEELLSLREMFDTTVSAFENELEDLARQQPEIVPWLDTPVPPSLLQD